MLDYPSLFALATVVQEGSFERAARVLHVTPSAISQRVRLLEERIGCTLVIRDQPCVATEMGRRLCQHVDRIRLLEHELRGQLPSFEQDERLRVNLPVAVNADSLATWFVDAMSLFAIQAPVLLQTVVDDEGHTAEWLRNGSVLAAVTATERPAAGCNSQALGVMRYVAAASPIFVSRFFPKGVNADSLSVAPSLRFSPKDVLQQRWATQLCHQHIELPHHTLPSTQGFVAATEAGMGWSLHPLALVKNQLERGQLVELVPETPLDVPLYWQQARNASMLLDGLTNAVIQVAKKALLSSPNFKE